VESVTGETKSCEGFDSRYVFGVYRNLLGIENPLCECTFCLSLASCEASCVPPTIISITTHDIEMRSFATYQGPFGDDNF